jgi:hypothetical protein
VFPCLLFLPPLQKLFKSFPILMITPEYHDNRPKQTTPQNSLPTPKENIS